MQEQEIEISAKRDWASFEKKLKRGSALYDAASEAGIPIEEAFTYVSDKLAKSEATSYELKAVANHALAVALKTLVKVAEEGPREAYSETDDDGNVRNITPLSTDLEASKALAKLAIDAIKVSNTIITKRELGQSGGGVSATLGFSVDLWDLKKGEA